ncbi:hypothetical protein I552_2241 [Mycobacterium xenopi 3993]|nr:hypothetical protein I552_2241 [Mycobacterium xenopi 3993]
MRSSYEAMRTGLITDGPKSHVQLDLDVECLTPVWDAEAAPPLRRALAWPNNPGHVSITSN